MQYEPKFKNNLQELLDKHKLSNKQFAKIIEKSTIAVYGMKTGRISTSLWIEDFEKIFKERVCEEPFLPDLGRHK